MESYSGLARAIHWAVAVLVLAMIPAGLVMVQDGLPRPVQNGLFIFHKNVGVVVLLLMLVRLGVRRLRPPPDLPAHLPGWQRRAAAASHAGLYGLAILVPVAGYVRVRAGGFPVEWLDTLGVPALVPRSDALAQAAQTTHYVAALTFAALIGLHVLAAFYHGVLRRDGVFGRIWPPVGRAGAERAASGPPGDGGAPS
ncbi:cytochrome b [Rhodovulum sp. 12E13]|uniref:cytochrome b n=1 Tax=Rhodovulum sp. 12E13 TaxID=2203891 RepID=UPI001F1F8B4B|nr:cytochrome b [Rhodovulum sp. 12E13]